MGTDEAPTTPKIGPLAPSWAVLISLRRHPPIGVSHSGRSQKTHRATHRADFETILKVLVVILIQFGDP